MSTTKAFYISEDDAPILRAIINEARLRDKSQDTPKELPEENEPPSFTPEVYIAEIPNNGVPALEFVGGQYIPGTATCNIHEISPDGSGVYELVQTHFDKDIYNISDAAVSGPRSATGTGSNPPKKFKLVIRDKFGSWIIDGEPVSLIGGRLAEDHPGRGVAFDLYLGTWNKDSDSWVYDTSEVVKAIDWRYGVPYPDIGATGLFTPRPSTTYGSIYECVSLDCESNGETGTGA